jgi:Flp pilus assembly protein TadG
LDRTRRDEAGAAVIEFALVVPLLLAVLMGVLEFSNYFRVQISVSQAAREAARSYAITHDTGLATTAGKAGAPSLSAGSLTFSYTGPATCDPAAVPAQTVTAVAAYPYATLTGFTLPPFLNVTMPTQVRGTSAMRCGG